MHTQFITIWQPTTHVAIGERRPRSDPAIGRRLFVPANHDVQSSVSTHPELGQGKGVPA
jgi:hypothetical protein